jgi:hypothetical protein
MFRKVSSPKSSFDKYYLCKTPFSRKIPIDPSGFNSLHSCTKISISEISPLQAFKKTVNLSRGNSTEVTSDTKALCRRFQVVLKRAVSQVAIKRAPSGQPH